MTAKVFVSYSRKDTEAARRLVKAFEDAGYNVWVDLEDIHPAANWMDEIESGIEKSDVFVFLLSPDSIKSEVCNIEVNHAAKYNKRIVPVIVRDVASRDTSRTISDIQWISLREADDFEQSVQKIRDAIELDFAWVSEHNKLLEKSLDWHHGKVASLLLRGSELRRVLKEVEKAASREPKLTEMQEKYLQYSIKDERRRRFLIAIASAVVVVLTSLTFFAISQRNRAEVNEQLANKNAVLANEQRLLAEDNADLAQKNEQEARAAQFEAEKQRLFAEERARFALAQQSAARAQIYQSQPGELYTSTLLAVASWTTAPSDEANEILRRNISLLPIPVEQTRREGAIHSLEFNAQGDLFVTGGADGNACVWNVSDGALLFCRPSPGSVNDVVFSPNGRYLVTGDESGLVQIFELDTRNQVGTFEAGAVINDLDVRRASDQIAVTRDDGRITLLDMTGRRKYDLQASGRLKIASFSPDGTYIASGSDIGGVTLWNLVEGGPPVSSGRHQGEVLALAFSPDSRYLITGGMDGYAVAARTINGQEVYRLLHEDWVTDIAFNSDSVWFATVSSDQRIRLWDTTDGEERLRMSQGSVVNEVKVSANGQWIATTGADKTVRVWNASTGAEMFQIPLDGDGTALGFGGDGKNLVSGDLSGGVNVWDISVMPTPQNYLQFRNLTGDVQYSPSGNWLAASDGPRVWLLRPAQLSTLTTRTLGEPNLTLNGDVMNVVFSPDSVWVGVSTVNGQVLVYNLETRQPKTLFQTGLAQQIAFTPDGSYLVASNSAGVVDLWSLASFRKTSELAGEGSGVLSVAVSPTYIALGAMDKILLLSPLGEAVTEIDTPGDHTLLAFSPDGSLLASSNSAGLVEVWKFENGNFSRVEAIRKEVVRSLAFNPNGSVLAVGARNNVFLVNSQTVQEVARIPHAGDVTGLSYSADGQVMATASLRAIQFWDMTSLSSLETKDLVRAACSRLTANFSQAQWSNLFGTEEYRVLCPDLPVP